MIPFVDFKRKYKAYQKDIMRVIARVFQRGWFILGPELEKFEKDFSEYIGISHAVGVNSGTDAIFLALKALGIGAGDEVITVANTAVPTISAIRMTGAIPVFIDIDEKTLTIDVKKIEPSITKKTKAIVPVHLYGFAADMSAVMRIAKKHKLKVVEDACQAHGALYKGKKVGVWGDAGCFSFYPTKNLGAFGDAGAVTTNNKSVANAVRSLRNYGEISKFNNEIEGVNSRLDEMQAAVLQWELTKLDSWNTQREKLAQLYCKYLKDVPVSLPAQSNFACERVWHLFVVQTSRRDELKAFLKEHGIETAIHYPKPIFEQTAYAFLKYTEKDLPHTKKATETILSLPLYPEMTKQEVKKVCDAIRSFYERSK